MIFQVPINLEVNDKSVKAIIDLDTGFIGFTESIDNKEVEYYYGESPIEFKKALMKKLEPILADKISTNWKICLKNTNMKFVTKYLRENK